MHFLATGCRIANYKIPRTVPYSALGVVLISVRQRDPTKREEIIGGPVVPRMTRGSVNLTLV